MRCASRAQILRAALACLIAIVPAATLAQNVQVPAGYAPSQAIGYGPINGTYHPITPADGLPVAQQTTTSTDVSGTITTGGTYQTVIAASATRKGCLIQNPTTATEILSIKVGTMASPFTIAAGSTFSCSSGSIIVTDAITLTAATTGHAFVGIVQ